MANYNIRSLLPVVCAVILQCFADRVRAETVVPLDALRRAPESVEIESAIVRLKADVWRDSMPVVLLDLPAQSPKSAASGKPMTAGLKIVAQSGQHIPRGLRIDLAWVFWGDKIWESRPSEDEVTTTGSREFAMNNGPKWLPGTVVDVVVRIVDSRGNAHLLACRGQRIKHSW